MITRNILRSLGALAALMLALLIFSSPATAQAPPPDVRFIRIDADDYRCELINAPPTEAQHEKPSPKTPIFGSPSPTMSQKPSQETTATYAIPPTFTPSIQASPTPTTTHASPTQETARTTPTATAYPTAVVTPLSACSGRIMALEGLNVRAMPSLTGRVVGGVGYGANVDLFARAGFDTWYRVQWGSEWGYIYAAHVGDVSAACWGLLAD